MQEYQGQGVRAEPIAMPTKQGIYEESSTQQTDLGTRIKVGDRVFFYAHVSTAADLVAGQLQGAADVLAGHINNTVAASAIQGTNKVSVYMTTDTTVDYFAEGYMAVNDMTGQGHIYRVRSHPAIGAAATGTFTLYDGILVALGITASQVSFIANNYQYVSIKESTTGQLAVGIAPIAVTSNYFFWCQTWGLASIELGENIGTGEPICHDTASDGLFAALDKSSTADARVLGHLMYTGSDTEFPIAFLTINP